MHVMDHVQGTYIEVSQPVHHYIIFFHYFIIIKILGCDWCIFRSYLIVRFLIHTTVDCVKQAFCKVCTGTEELDLFSCLCGRYTAADGVIIAPYRTHSADFQCSPNRITGEQLVVGLDSCKFYHTEFHCHMVDEFLCFFLCQNAVFQISLDVNIKEC